VDPLADDILARQGSGGTGLVIVKKTGNAAACMYAELTQKGANAYFYCADSTGKAGFFTGTAAQLTATGANCNATNAVCPAATTG
jgi:hypothetical protein